MDTAKAQALLDTPVGTIAPAGAMDTQMAPSPALTPLTASAVAAAAGVTGPKPKPNILDPMFSANARKQDYVDSNQEGDIPLDVDLGIDGWTRAAMSFRRTTADKVAELEEKYPGKVRLSHDGVPIVRVISSETGKPKDIRVQELGTSLSDFLDMVGQVPQMAAGFLAARYGGGTGPAATGIIPKLGNILSMAAGQESAGAVQDAATRAIDKQPIDLPEIASTRSKMAAMDVGAGALMTAPAIAAKIVQKLATPFGTQNQLTSQFKDAVKYFADKGVTLPMTPAESSGSQLLGRVEAMARQLPGSSTVFKGIVDKQNAAITGIQKIAMGLDKDASVVLPDAETTGSKVIDALGDKNTAVEQRAAAAKSDLETTGSSELGKGVTAAIGAGPAEIAQTGQNLRASALAKREAFQAQSSSDYQKVYEHPLAKSYEFSGDALADRAKTLIKELPAPETITEKPTGILDEFGNEILRDEAGRKVERNFVPKGILPMLNDLSTKEGSKFRLGDLLKMRTEVSNRIAEGEAVPGVQTHYLNEIRKALDESIKAGLDKLPDKSLKNLWETANNNYARGVKPFQQSGIREIFKEPEQPGFLGDNQIVDRAIGGGAKGQDTFNAYKQFYGEASPEFTGLKRAVADKLLGSSMKAAGDTIDPVAFMKNLGDLAAKSPDVARSVFGAKSQQLQNIAKAMAAGDSGEMLTGSTWQKRLAGVRLDPDELQKMLSSGDLTSQKLVDLAMKEKAVASQYRNKILKSIGSGEFAGDSIRPSDFVRYFSTQAEPAEVNQVLSMLHDRPDLIQDIRSKVAQDIFDRAYPAAQAIDNPAMLSGEPRVLTQQGLQGALGDATQKARYRSILGADTYKDIEMLTSYLAPRGVSERAFSAAGGLSAGQQIAGLIRGGDLKYVDRTIKNWLMATVYTHPALRAWAGNTKVPNVNTAGFARYLIASTPVAEALHKDFGEKKAKDVMAQLSSSINKSQAEPKAKRAQSLQELLDQPVNN